MKTLYIVGIGPGAVEDMTMKAFRILERCDVIIGYTVYIELIRSCFPDKELIATPMRQEEKRCLMALETAESGKTTAMISSGDAGVYGMAGLLYNLSAGFPKVTLRVIPGVTSALSGAALLGAPLMHDFSLISLSDLMTPWELIEKRLRACAEADFVICLYNPASKKRNDYLSRACRILLNYRSSSTVCGIVRNISREGEEKQIMTLSELEHYPADMFTTVFIGNSKTRSQNGFMVTPRGYSSEKKNSMER